MRIGLSLGLGARSAVTASEWASAQALREANTAPPWEPDRTINTAGNSLSASVGSAISTITVLPVWRPANILDA